MKPSARKAHLRAAALPALIVALLIADLGEPAHAQGGFLKKLQGVSRSIKDKAEKADSVATKADETVEAVECVANDADCAEEPEAEGPPEGVADSSGVSLPSPAAASAPGQRESQPRAPPDSSEA